VALSAARLIGVEFRDVRLAPQNKNWRQASSTASIAEYFAPRAIFSPILKFT
jgi:hypothetical protein